MQAKEIVRYDVGDEFHSFQFKERTPKGTLDENGKNCPRTEGVFTSI